MNIKIVFIKEIQYLNTCFKFVEGLGIMQCILFSCFYQRFVIIIQIPGSVNSVKACLMATSFE